MMQSPPKSQLSRRDLLRLALTASAVGVSGASLAGVAAQAGAPASGGTPALRKVSPQDRRLLFVVCAYGGASIIDSFLPVVDYEAPDYLSAQALNTFPGWGVEQVPGSNIRTPTLLDSYEIYAKPTFSLGQFLTRHGADVAVIAHDVSSVNHTIGQQRSLNGAGIDRGRTLMESMALQYGGGLALPSCNMASDGYLRHGADGSIPTEARHELISAPLFFSAGTHGYKGVDGAPDAATIARARAARDGLEQKSIFGQTFRDDPRRSKFLASRATSSQALENQGLFEKLFLLDPSKLDPRFATKLDPLSLAVRQTLPDLDVDKTEAQVALGFLMAYHGVSTSVAMGLPTDPYVTPSGDITGSPIAFDFSHNSHRVVQSLMWSRTMSMVDKLITLLKAHDYMGDPSLGKMWDRSLVYVATEFGRDKARPVLAGSWGTAHNLNNGSVIISPLVRGNAVYGGVDPSTCLTYGFDPTTGAPTPGAVMSEADVYGIITQALGVEVLGAKKYPAVVRG